MKKNGVMSLLRRYILAGLLVWLPLIATFVVFRFIIDLLDKTLTFLPNEYQPSVLLGVNIPGMGVVFSVVIVILTGFIASNFLGHQLVNLWEAIVRRIPLVRTIYISVKQVLTSLFSSGEQSFRKVMLVEYPRRGLWHIAFLTGDHFEPAEQEAGKPVYTLFIPTTPNPTSGFLIIAPCDDVVELNMSIDEALKMVISLGVMRPPKNK